MKTIIPIGGGDINEKTTLSIDQFIINLVCKEIKKVLFIPIASGDMPSYIEKFTHYYSELGCKVDVLCLTKTQDDETIRNKILTNDILYIGGGNTAKLMRIFKRTKINEYLKIAYEKGIILTGLSAGAMVYFQNGYSDCNRSTNPLASLSLIKCLNFIPYCFCPHYNEAERESFDCFVSNKQLNGLALEDNTALFYQDGVIKGILSSKADAKGYIIHQGKKEEINNAIFR